MNCKPGDLAVIVRTGQWTKNLRGRIVTVIERAPDVSSLFGDQSACAVWHYEPVLRNDLGRTVEVMNDICLRPIRDSDGEDETLTWAGKPEQVAA